MPEKQMTNYQRKLAEENLHCVDWVISKRVRVFNLPLLDHDELYQVGCEALCNAAMTFDPIKGGFEPYASRVIYNEILSHCQRTYAHASRCVELIGPDGEDDFFEAQISTEKLDYEDMITEREVLDRLRVYKNQFTGVVQKGVEALELKLLGYKTAEIAKRYGTTVNNVNAWISKARTRIKKDAGLTLLFL